MVFHITLMVVCGTIVTTVCIITFFTIMVIYIYNRIKHSAPGIGITINTGISGQTDSINHTNSITINTIGMVDDQIVRNHPTIEQKDVNNLNFEIMNKKFDVRNVYGLVVVNLSMNNKPMYRAAIPKDPLVTTLDDWANSGEGTTPEEAIEDLNNKMKVINTTNI